jgi:hypothetical protein
MNRADTRVMEIARVLAGIRKALGLAPDTRADLMAAFAAEDGELEELREALGRAITVCDKQAITAALTGNRSR